MDSIFNEIIIPIEESQNLKKNAGNPCEIYRKLNKEAVEFGFNWSDTQMVIDKTITECHKVEETIKNTSSTTALPATDLQEKVGDLIQATLAMCLFFGFDINETIQKANEKFATRIKKVKELTHQQGLTDLNQETVPFKLKIWEKAKK